MVDTLIGTFLGDTAAYFGGRAFGREPARALAFAEQDGRGAGLRHRRRHARLLVFAVGYQDWMSGADALVIGVSVALAAPIGDLFESMIKRDLDVKDTGRLFGAHGGALDRLDAVLFSVVTAYYVALAVL